MLVALILAAALTLLVLAAFPGEALASEFQVTSTADTTGSGTLRWAITQANVSSDADTITFNISGEGVHTIALTSALPTINYPVTIDATIQPGWSAGNPQVELDGSSAGTDASGLVFGSDATGSRVRGLAIFNFTGTGTDAGYGILLKAGSCVVDGCYLGVDASGTGTGNGNNFGIYTEGTGNTIGGTTPAERNVISCNAYQGILAEGMVGSGATGTIIQGNYIGTDENGTTDLGNRYNGVVLHILCHNSRVGGTGPGEGNVISGNGTAATNEAGINIQSSNGCVVQGNLIGLAADGDTVLANATGISVIGNCSSFTIGGTGAGARNVISGNGRGIYTECGGALIHGNYVGTDAGGRLDRGNTGNGITLASGGNGAGTVGGTATGAGNVISGNDGIGISIVGTNGQVIQGNMIGVDCDGDDPLGNGTGIVLDSSDGNTIGGTETAARNVISGNSGGGVPIVNYSDNNTVRGNIIGLARDGATPAGNGWTGVEVASSSQNNSIGGTETGAGNVISCNGGNGISLIHPSSPYSPGTINNTVQGNRIGTDEGGTLDRGNTGDGVGIHNITGNYAGINTIGGAAAGAGNVISWNRRGVFITNSVRQIVQGNRIGTDSGGAADCGNTEDGVLIQNCPSTWGVNSIGGTGAGEGNVISGNDRGVCLANSPAQVVRGNLIGTEADGTGGVGNVHEGVLCTSASNTNLGNNVIAGNGTDGVAVTGSSGCSVHDNLIGLDSTGDTILANGANGVYLHNNIGANNISTGNTISGNGANGVYSDCAGQAIAGNRIGTNAGGTLERGNALDGVYVTGGNATTIGGAASGAGNVISGNGACGVHLVGSDSPVVRGNTIGLDSAGGAALPNSAHGVWLEGSGNSTIGGAAGSRNVISGNGGDGVRIDQGDGHTVLGNYVGTDASGSLDRGNAGDGVCVTGANGTTVGGTGAGEGNVVSGNGSRGVAFTGSTGCFVRGNVIGLDAAGDAAVGNGSDGVYLEGNTATNIVGGTTTGTRNVISGNGGSGVSLSNCTVHVVQGNYIGTDAGGTLDRGNDLDGIYLSGANSNAIGGTVAGACNVVSGNGRSGVHIESSMINTVQGNLVGTDAGGSADVGNTGSGVLVSTSNNTIVGGTAAGARNVISGNGTYGVHITGSIGCLVQNNLVGLDSPGTSAVGNSQSGVCLDGNPGSNTVGGTVAAARNVISGNLGNGVYVTGSTGQLVAGNYVGLLEDGTTAMANGLCGILMYSNPNANTIGGISAGARNVISGNGQHGVFMERSRDQLMQGNFVGTGSGGTGDRGNGGNGVYIYLGSNNTVGGNTAAERNVISGNDAGGVTVDESDGNAIQGNYVGRDSASAPLPNTGTGVYVCNGSDGTTVGGSAAGANLIGDNGADGVGVRGSADCVISHNQVLDNTGIGIVVWDKTAYRDKVSENSINGNGALGIDLLGDGVTPNDGNNNNPAKPNRGYNFPVIAGAYFQGGGDVLVIGTAPPDSTVELYAAGTPDASGHGQGLLYLGATTAGGTGEFTIILSGLSLGDYISATATSPAGNASGEGNTSEFSANEQVVDAPSVPTVATEAADGITASGATLHGTLENDGGEDVDQRGFRYRVKGTGTWTDLPDGGTPPFAEGVYSIPVTGLSPNTTYEFYASAHNMVGWDEGDTLEFTTLTAMPAVTTQDADGVTSTGATLHGIIEENGGEDADQRGFWYQVKGSGSWTYIGDPGTPPFGEGAYSLELTGLELNTTYEFYAVAHNSFGWGVGGTLDFKTLASLPTVTTQDATSVTTSGATLHGTITDNGGEDAGRRGFRHRKKGSSDWIDWTETGTFGTGAFSHPLTGLTPGTGYEYQATARNRSGTVHGNTVKFTTEEGPRSLSAWYLAEGTNAWGFSTYITLENPNDSAVAVKLTYLDPNAPAAGKGMIKSRTITLPPLSQTTVSSAEDIGQVDFSTKVESLEGKTIAVDRTMFWAAPDPSVRGYHSSIGTNSLSKTWYLPEGSSNWGFETWTLVLNPNETEASITITYMTDGGGPKILNKKIPARCRATYNMLADIGSADASIQVTSDIPVVAERSMYRNNRREGSCSIGATTPATDYLLAEGATGYDVGFTTWVLIQNPNDAATDVTLTYQTSTGTVPGPTFTMPANSRKTVKVNDALPPNTDVSTTVHGSRPVIAERAVYWDNGTGQAFHASIGLEGPHRSFMLPDGQTSSGFETWTLVQNPNGTDVEVIFSYMTPSGQGNVTRTEAIPANSRRTFNMAEHHGITGRAAIMVTCKTSGKKVMVERAMYWNNRGAGTDTIGGYSD